MREYRTIIPFIKENLGRYIIGLIALFVVDIASLIMPQVLRAFGDWAQLGELTLPRIAEIAVTILVLGLFVAMGRFGWRKYIFGTARRLEYWLRDRLFGKYLTLDDTFFNHHRTGDLMAHATNDVLMVRNSMGGGIIMIVDAVFMTIFTVGMMIYTVGLRTAAVALLALPFLTVMVYGLTGPLQRRSRDVQDTFSEMTTEVQENISGMASIKAFGIEADRADAFNVINERYREKNLRLVKISAFFDPLISLISGVAFVIFLFYGVRRIIVGELSLGDFIAVISYLNMMVWPLIAMGMVVSSFQRGIAERGSTLSAGQRQLLSFARTIAARPSLLILDEATASIDTETEVLIQEAIRNMSENRSMIAVAHRISTIADADKIIVMHHGHVAEQGTKEELLAQDGLFAVLYELQYQEGAAT